MKDSRNKELGLKYEFMVKEVFKRMYSCMMSVLLYVYRLYFGFNLSIFLMLMYFRYKFFNSNFYLFWYCQVFKGNWYCNSV